MTYEQLLQRLCLEWRSHKPDPRYRTRGYLPKGER